MRYCEEYVVYLADSSDLSQNGDLFPPHLPRQSFLVQSFDEL